MKKPLVLLNVLCLLGFAFIARAEPVISGSGSVSWTENITRSPYEEAGKDAAIYAASAEAEWRNQLSRDLSLAFSTKAGLEKCPRFDGLDRTLAGLTLAARRKAGLGPMAPVFRADLSFTGSWYRETMRTGNRWDAGLSWSKRWSDSWQTVLAADFMVNNGRARVYDYQHGGLSLEGRYDLSDRWQLTGGLKREWGDQVTYAWIGGSGASFPYVFEIWKNTTDIPTYGPNWQAYTMSAHADKVWLELSPALGRDRSLPIRYEQTIVVGHGESYLTRMLSLSYVQRF